MTFTIQGRKNSFTSLDTLFEATQFFKMLSSPCFTSSFTNNLLVIIWLLNAASMPKSLNAITKEVLVPEDVRIVIIH